MQCHTTHVTALRQEKLDAMVDVMPAGVDMVRGWVNNQATKLLIKAQMLMPQQRWVQPTLAVASASAVGITLTLHVSSS